MVASARADASDEGQDEDAAEAAVPALGKEFVPDSFESDAIATSIRRSGRTIQFSVSEDEYPYADADPADDRQLLTEKHPGSTFYCDRVPEVIPSN